MAGPPEKKTFRTYNLTTQLEETLQPLETKHNHDRSSVLAKVNADYLRQAAIYNISVEELKSVLENPDIKSAEVFWLMQNESKSLTEAMADPRAKSDKLSK